MVCFDFWKLRTFISFFWREGGRGRGGGKEGEEGGRIYIYINIHIYVHTYILTHMRTHTHTYIYIPGTKGKPLSITSVTWMWQSLPSGLLLVSIH